MTTSTAVRLIFSLLVAIPLAVLAPTAALADDPPRAASLIDLELTEVAAQSRRAVRFTLAVQPGRSGRIETSSGKAFYKVDLGTERVESQSLLALRLERSDQTPGGHLSVSLTAPLPPGQRKVLATIDRGDGSALEIAATLR